MRVDCITASAPLQTGTICMAPRADVDGIHFYSYFLPWMAEMPVLSVMKELRQCS
jgi:hypothetical protein